MELKISSVVFMELDNKNSSVKSLKLKRIFEI